MRYAFIQAHERAHRVTWLCAALAVSRSGYYARRHRPVNRPGQGGSAITLCSIRRVHTQTREQYGAVKLWHALTTAGIGVGGIA